VADGFVDDASQVAVPEEALEAHESFTRMFIAWQSWANATVEAFSAGDNAGERELLTMASLQQESLRHTELHHADVQRMLKAHKLPGSESSRIMQEALAD
jgi:predicted transcriptional regulator